MVSQIVPHVEVARRNSQELPPEIVGSSSQTSDAKAVMICSQNIREG